MASNKAPITYSAAVEEIGSLVSSGNILTFNERFDLELL